MQKVVPFFLIYSLIGVIHLLGFLMNWSEVVFFTKPLLLLTLIVLVFSRKNFFGKNLLVIALIFSWFGDIFLQYQEQNDVFFILGLSSFLTSHIFYIVLFSKLNKEKKKSPLVIVLIAIYLIALMYWLTPYLDKLQIPVYLYAFVISLMLYFAHSLSLDLPKSGRILFIGSIAFTLSDSVLAINKFYESVPFSGVIIMSTYIFAQGSICWAILTNNLSSSN